MPVCAMESKKWIGMGLDGMVNVNVLLRAHLALINLKLNVSIVVDREDPIDVVKDV